MNPWVEVALSVVYVVMVVALGVIVWKAIVTHDAAEDGGRVTSRTLHRLRNPRL